jgi:hypothetical protein
MPSEASTASSSTLPTSLLDPAPLLKCTLCGISQAQDGTDRMQATSGSQRGQALCEGCLRTIAVTNASVESLSEPSLLAAVIEVESDNVENETSRRWSRSPTNSDSVNGPSDTPPPLLLAPAHPIPTAPISYASAISQSPTSCRPVGPHSLPVPIPRPWSTSTPATTVLPFTPSTSRSVAEPPPTEDKPGNPLLDVALLRAPSVGRGCLYPGSVFRGTQTSGRSAYEVEVKLLVSTRTRPLAEHSGRLIPRFHIIRLPLHFASHRHSSTSHNFCKSLVCSAIDRLTTSSLGRSSGLASVS